jgi:threonine dehydratase
MLLVPVSGGGLLSGMALAAKQINPNIHVVGLSLEQSPAMLASLEAGKPVKVEEKNSLADSLLGGIGVENHYNLPLIKRYVDEHILVSEEDIKTGMYSAYSSQQMIIEGAAAVGIGAIINKKLDIRGKRVVSILTGRSIDTSKYHQVITEQQRTGGRR